MSPMLQSRSKTVVFMLGFFGTTMLCTDTASPQRMRRPQRFPALAEYEPDTYWAMPVAVTRSMVANRVSVYATCTFKKRRDIDILLLDQQASRVIASKEVKAARTVEKGGDAAHDKDRTIVIKLATWALVDLAGIYPVVFRVRHGRADETFLCAGVRSTEEPAVIKSYSVDPEKGVKFEIRYTLGRTSDVTLRSVLIKEEKEVWNSPEGKCRPNTEGERWWDATSSDSGTYSVEINAVPSADSDDYDVKMRTVER